MLEIFKIAGKIIDAYDDPEFLQHPLTQQKLGTDVLDTAELELQPDSAFAVKIASKAGTHRRYPVYNPVITSISCQYFESVKDSLPVEIEKAAGYQLKAACLRHGLPVPNYLSGYDITSPLVLNVSAKVDVNTIEQEKIASAYEEALWYKMPRLSPDDRCAAASDFCKTAGYDAIVHQIVWDYVPKPIAGPLLESAIEDRFELLKAAENVVLINILNDIEEGAEAATTAVTVSRLVSLDKMAGFDKRYVAGFTDPYMAVYGGHELPHQIIKRKLEEQDFSKFAGPINPETGRPLSEDVSKTMTTAQHLAKLQEQFPKGSQAYLKKQASHVTPEVETKFGSSYIKARNIHFSK